MCSSDPPVLWFLFHLARSARRLQANQSSYPAGIARNLARLALLVPIFAALDAAAFIGALNWLLRDKLQLLGSELRK